MYVPNVAKLSMKAPNLNDIKWFIPVKNLSSVALMAAESDFLSSSICAPISGSIPVIGLTYALIILAIRHLPSPLT